MKVIIIEGTPREIKKTIVGLQKQGIISPGTTTVENGPGTVETVPAQSDQPEEPDQAKIIAPKTVRKKEPINYYKEGSPYKQIVDMYNRICTKLARREPRVNYQLKLQLDKLITGHSPYSMEDIKQAFENIQNGGWFDDFEVREAYGNFMWVTQRQKIEKALMGSYNRNCNNEKYEINQGNNGSIRSGVNREIGGESVQIKVADF